MIPGIPAEYEFKKTPIFLEFLRHGNFRVTKKKKEKEIGKVRYVREDSV